MKLKESCVMQSNQSIVKLQSLPKSSIEGAYNIKVVLSFMSFQQWSRHDAIILRAYHVYYVIHLGFR